MVGETYRPDGTGHCKTCGRDVRAHESVDPDDPGRVLACPETLDDLIEQIESKR